ncbi:MAG: thiamine pyrophosphate-dependent enzyme [Treponema sp.]|nr:thiamine pyrophosphate-dependent enzyme [Treponema sp.]
MSKNTDILALLGDEALALGAIHAGLSAAYGYPGTPSTEILTYLINKAEAGLPITARWCSNEKTALEAALGTSFAGKRALFTTKHVGLNIAADPYMNAALLGIKGGLVIAVADDPGMHSSQGEQDSRYYSSFSLTPCLEPRSQQEAYDVTLEAFELSERLNIPVMIRLVTRLSHARAAVTPKPERKQNNLDRVKDISQWMLMPAYARKNYERLLEKQKELLSWSSRYALNKLDAGDESFAVITSGLGGNYYEENLKDLTAARGKTPSRLHIGAYPLPVDLIQKVCEKAVEVLVIEEGQPFIEEKIRGLLPGKIAVKGKLSGELNRTGELDPDNVRKSLGLLPLPGLDASNLKIPELPGRPPQLCQGCPHGDSYLALNKALADLGGGVGTANTVVTSDIGCYSLGAAPPYKSIETCICMGAAVTVARGAADAGIKYAVATIGDSTFLHSGITGLIDAVETNVPMTLIILDNSIVAMTGCQKTILPSEKLKDLILGIGVEEEHILVLEAKHQLIDENAGRLKNELEYRGLSVVIFKRECLEAIRKRRK